MTLQGDNKENDLVRNDVPNVGQFLHHSGPSSPSPDGSIVELLLVVGLSKPLSGTTEDRRMSRSLALPALICRAWPLPYSTLRARRMGEFLNSSAGVSNSGETASSSPDERSGSSVMNWLRSPSFDFARLVCRTMVAWRPTLPCHVSPSLSGNGGSSGSGDGSPSPPRLITVLLALRIADASDIRRDSSGAGVRRWKYSSSATSFSSLSSVGSAAPAAATPRRRLQPPDSGQSLHHSVHARQSLGKDGSKSRWAYVECLP